jgi:hypothetical protein
MTVLEQLMKYHKQIELLDKQILKITPLAEKIVNEDWLLSFNFKALNVVSVDFDNNEPAMILMGPNGPQPMPMELRSLFGMGGHVTKKEEGEGENEFKLDKNTMASVLTVILKSFNEQKVALTNKMITLSKELTVQA